jgi:DNA repair protein RadC
MITLLNNDIAEIKISYSHKVRPSDMRKLSGSEDAYELLLSVWDMGNIDYIEEFMCIYLTRANKVLGVKKISQGGVSGTVADPKLIFQSALKTNSSAVILAHNHPSGNCTPSDADKALTRKVQMAGQVLEISVLDHIIVNRDSFYSMADNGDM